MYSKIKIFLFIVFIILSIISCNDNYNDNSDFSTFHGKWVGSTQSHITITESEMLYYHYSGSHSFGLTDITVTLVKNKGIYKNDYPYGFTFNGKAKILIYGSNSVFNGQSFSITYYLHNNKQSIHDGIEVYYKE